MLYVASWQDFYLFRISATYHSETLPLLCANLAQPLSASRLCFHLRETVILACRAPLGQGLEGLKVPVPVTFVELVETF